MRKLKILQLTLVILFVVFIFFLFRPVDYTKEYTIDNVKISEAYSKETKSYYFTFTYQDNTLDYLIDSNYKQKRNFIKEVKVIEDDNNFCLIPEADTLEFVPLCIEENEIIYYKKVSDELRNQIPEEYLKEEKELEESYKEINIYNRDYTYLLWNYQGFYYINDEETKEIDLFKKEIYNIPLISYTEDYLVIADYDDEYTFDKFYRISLQNGKVKEYNLDKNIYFDSYFSGYEKNKLYIVDNKEEVMYEWNAQNGSLEKIAPKMLQDNEWVSVGIKTLINQNKRFTYQNNYQFQLDDQVLTLNYRDSELKMIIDEDVTSIVRIKNSQVFYLKTDTLYVFDHLSGSTRLLNNFEWNFNYENMIYVD